IGGDAGDAEHSEEALWRSAEVRKLIGGARRKHRLVAPTAHVLHKIARLEPIKSALDDLADGAAFQRLAYLKRWNVAFHVVHPSAHVRVDRKPQVLDAQLADPY